MRSIHLGMSACDCAKLEPFREISSDCHGRLARLGGCSGRRVFLPMRTPDGMSVTESLDLRKMEIILRFVEG